jgi:hypothetical protein
MTTQNKKRFVIDTNVFISAALLSNSLPHRVVVWIQKNAILLQSISTSFEIEDVLHRRKFDRYVPEKQRLDFMRGLLSDAMFVTVEDTITECRDPKDNKFLELAVSGEATAIISGDEDLLVLHPFRGIPILTPRQFLDEYQDTPET